jgi:hypothetical protein
MLRSVSIQMSSMLTHDEYQRIELCERERENSVGGELARKMKFSLSFPFNYDDGLRTRNSILGHQLPMPYNNITLTDSLMKEQNKLNAFSL